MKTGAHTTGPGAKLFNGYYDNTDIFRKLFAVMGLEAQVASAR